MIKFDFKVILNKAIRRVRSDITDGVANAVQLNGAGYTPNKKSVSDRKGFDHRLVGKNKRFLKPSTYKIESATTQKQKATLSFVSDEDARIGLFNQAPTGAGAIAEADAVVFFGVSEQAEQDMLDDVDEYINERTDREIISWGFKKV